MQSAPPWNELFAPVTKPGWKVRFRVLRKRGQPLLLLPGDPALAAMGLQLFPAQTFAARLARTAARLLVRANLTIGAEYIEIPLAPEEPFTAFLLAQSSHTDLQALRLAVLAGNAATSGRRFIILTYDKQRRPARVAKVGVTPAARELVRAERAFLERVLPASHRGIPALRGSLETERVSAFSMDHVSGRTPRSDVNFELLRSWLKPGALEITSTPAWQRLRLASGGDPALASLGRRLGARQMSCAVWHGDFAPWNIKVDAEGRWTALDWERGELQGIPAWDCFHYVIQREILVRKAPAESVSRAANHLIGSDQFRGYSRAAGIEGIERDLLQAYLLYMRDVIKPSEGAAIIRELAG